MSCSYSYIVPHHPLTYNLGLSEDTASLHPCYIYRHHKLPKDRVPYIYTFFLFSPLSFLFGLFVLQMFLDFRCTATHEGTFFT